MIVEQFVTLVETEGFIFNGLHRIIKYEYSGGSLGIRPLGKTWKVSLKVPEAMKDSEACHNIKSGEGDSIKEAFLSALNYRIPTLAEAQAKVQEVRDSHQAASGGPKIDPKDAFAKFLGD